MSTTPENIPGATLRLTTSVLHRLDANTMEAVRDKDNPEHVRVRSKAGFLIGDWFLNDVKEALAGRGLILGPDDPADGSFAVTGYSREGQPTVPEGLLDDEQVVEG